MARLLMKGRRSAVVYVFVVVDDFIGFSSSPSSFGLVTMLPLLVKQMFEHTRMTINCQTGGDDARPVIE